MTATWPAELPQFVSEQGFSESLPNLRLESSVDTGEPKVRRRFTKNLRAVQWSIQCDADQRAAFDTFYLDTLKGGILPFQWVNPLTQAAAEFKFRGSPPTYTAFGGINVRIAMTLWQTKQFAPARFDVDAITFDSDQYTFDSANRY